MKKTKYRVNRESRIKELRAQCQLLSNERADLETVNEREDAAPWLGRCFKYLNRDSGGKTWWLYIRVLAHSSGNAFKALQCQSQTGGWHIAHDSEHIYLLPNPTERGYVPITRGQFDVAWRQFAARVSALNDGT